jgi:deoxyribonuclease V
MIACLDVHYRAAQARAAAVLLDSWTQHTPTASYVTDIADVQPYQPGSFYRRELPCLLAVLRLLPAAPRVIVIDGYAWVSPERGPGLGARLGDALPYRAIVVGVAKSEFASLAGSALVDLVYRGASRVPLFVSSIGIGPREAGALVREMHGSHRIPDVLRSVDQLARNTGPIAPAR